MASTATVPVACFVFWTERRRCHALFMHFLCKLRHHFNHFLFVEKRKNQKTAGSFEKLQMKKFKWIRPKWPTSLIFGFPASLQRGNLQFGERKEKNKTANSSTPQHATWRQWQQRQQAVGPRVGPIYCAAASSLQILCAYHLTTSIAWAENHHAAWRAKTESAMCSVAWA